MEQQQLMPKYLFPPLSKDSDWVLASGSSSSEEGEGLQAGQSKSCSEVALDRPAGTARLQLDAELV